MKEFKMLNLIKENIHAVHDKDLENILDGLGILNKFKHGELKCKFCDKIINFSNLHSIFPLSGSIKLVCDEPKCIMELSKLINEGDICL